MTLVSGWVKAHSTIFLFSMTKTIRYTPCMQVAHDIYQHLCVHDRWIYLLRRKTVSHPYSSFNTTTNCIQLYKLYLFSIPPLKSQHPLLISALPSGVCVTYSALVLVVGNYPRWQKCLCRRGNVRTRKSPPSRTETCSKHGRWRKRGFRIIFGPNLLSGPAGAPSLGIWHLSGGDWSIYESMSVEGWRETQSLRRCHLSDAGIKSQQWSVPRHSSDTWVWLSTWVNNCLCFGDELAKWPKCKPGVFLNMAVSNGGVNLERKENK